MSAKGARRAHEAKGRFAETLAAWRLRLAGYRIVARRARTPFGEIDLIAYNEPVLALVEVKARASVGRGLFSLSARQASRIAAAGAYFLARVR